MPKKIQLNQIDTVVTTVGTPWTDDNIPTEKAVRDAILAISWGVSWPVSWLDWVVSDSAANITYYANYRWATTWTRAVGGVWAWYDRPTQVIFVSETNAIKRYDLQWNLLTTTVTTWAGGLIWWNETKRIIFTKNGCQKIDLNTWALLWTVGWVFQDISASWNVGISITNNQYNSWPQTFTITSFNTTTLATINTYTYTNNPWFWNNHLYWATLVNELSFIVHLTVGGNGTVSPELRKILISNNSTQATFTYTFLSMSAWWTILYSPWNNLIYYSRDINTWLSSRPTLYSISINLTWNAALPNNTNIPLYMYRTSDGSLWTQLATWVSFRTELIYRAIPKFWFSEPITNSVAVAQIAYTFT